MPHQEFRSSDLQASYTRTTDATEEPLDLAVVKTQLKVDPDIDDEDELIKNLIRLAREYAEEETNKALLTQTWELKLDVWPRVIRLAKHPVASVTSIKYFDEAGVEITWSNTLFKVDSGSDYDFTRITPIETEVYPVLLAEMAVITVTFVAGYTSPELIPANIMQGMLLIIGDLYENRQDSLPMQLHNIPLSAKNLFAKRRIHSF